MLDHNLPQKGDIVAGKYQIDRLLGSGGMGAVYQVTHRVTGKAFAIKWLLPRLSAENDAVQRFIREAQVAGRVDHPNIVEVYDVGQEGETFYMVMELLHGESLAQRLAANARLSPAEICQILIPVTRGLEAAHRAGVIHRDLKPDNIFLCREQDGPEFPKLLDFGISKMSELTGALSSGITRQGAIMGTPYYMAPEQMRGHSVDARTDVYALGVILYQALSGELPFTGETFADLLLKIVSTEPKPLLPLVPDVPAALISVVERALARDQAMRVESAAALGQLLQPFAAVGGSAAAGAGSRRPASNRASASLGTSTETPLATSFKPAHASAARRSGPIIIASTLALGALGASAWFVTSHSATEPQSSAAQPRAEEQRLVRPLPVKPVPEPVLLKPPSTLDEVLPTPHVTQLEPSPQNVDPVPVAPLATAQPAQPVPAVQQLSAAAGSEPLPPDGALKPLKQRKKKPRDDPFATKDERRAPRSDDVSVDDFLITPPARRVNNKP